MPSVSQTAPQDANVPHGGYAFVFKGAPFGNQNARKNKGANFSAATYANRNSKHMTEEEVISKTLSPEDAAEVRGILSKLRNGGGPPPVRTSKEEHTTTAPDGSVEYTKERKALHEKIIGDYFKKHGSTALRGKPPEVLFLGGLGGSGKSSFGDKARHNPLNVYKESDYMVADADKVKELIPGYAGHNAAVYHEESSHILKQLLAHAQDKGINTVIDGTMRTSQLGMMRSFKDKGFKVGAFYMYVPPETAAARALERWRGNGPGQRGRLVPPDIILGSTKNPANFDELRKHADRGDFYDNTGKAPKKVT